MSTNIRPTRNISTASRIIYRASTSILRDTTPRYTSEDRHALKLLSEYGI